METRKYTSIHLYPQRQNVAAQEELKTVTYATPPMEERRKNNNKTVYYHYKVTFGSQTLEDVAQVLQAEEVGSAGRHRLQELLPHALQGGPHRLQRCSPLPECRQAKLFIYLLKAYSPLNRTGSPQGF